MAQAFQEDPGAYRTHRAFVVVQAPSLFEVVEGLAQARDAGIPAERLTPVLDDLPRLLAVPAGIRAALEDARVEYLTLSLRAAAPALPAPEAPRPGRLGALLGGAQEVSGGALCSAASLSFEASRRVGSAASALGSYAGGTALDGLRRVTDPVLDSVAAARAALTAGAISGLVAGALMTLVFPPLAPWVAGLAILEIPDAFGAEMDRATRARVQERQLRQRLRGEELERALAILTGAERKLRIETPVLQLVIDLDGAGYEGTILAGRFAGHPLASLTPSDLDDLIRWAPDAATAEGLEAWRRANPLSGAL